MRANAGDTDIRTPAGFSRAFVNNRDPMLAAANGVLRDQAGAEDVVQDIFIQLWLSPRSYDPARGSLRSYLVMLARSRAIDRWRSRGVARAAIERADVQTASDDAAEIVIRRDGARAAVAAVGQLPPPQRDALLLAYAGGLSAREVADRAGIPIGTAKSRLRLGLTRARETLSAAS